MADARPGRILVVTSNYPRWAGDTTTPFVHDLCVDLTERGWSLTVLAPHAPDAKTVERLDGVAVRRFRYWLPARGETVCYGGGALINLRDGRAKAVKVPALVLAEWAALMRSLGDADVVHAHWALPQGFVAAATPRRNAPRVLTVHGGDIFGLRGRVLDRFTVAALRRADRVTVNSPATGDAVQRLAGAATETELIPFGADLSRPVDAQTASGVRSLYRRPSGPLLMFVGRVVEEKGVLDIVAALPSVIGRYPDATAVIAGTGQHVDRVRHLAGELGIEDRVHLTGWVEPADVPSWFAAADVVLAPSRIGPGGWEEGQGVAIVEAMATGAVVIGSNTGGIPYTITDGRSGRLVPPAEPEALAAAVIEIVADTDGSKKMGQVAQREARQRFGRSGTADRFDDLFRRLTRRSPPGAGR